MADINEILQEIVQEIGGVNYALLASKEGFILDSFIEDEEIDTETLAATTMHKLIETASLGESYNIGNLEGVMVECEDGIVFISNIGGDAVLIVKSSGKAMIGHIRIKMKHSKPLLEAEL
jgi:predicted regulator of Ras-like GTPase activity (Roadblock/LC7/MglB family)